MATPPPDGTRPLPRRDPRLDNLDYTKKATTDYMSEVRKGGATGWDADKRQEIIRDIVLPKHGWQHRMKNSYIGNWAPHGVYRDRFNASGIPSAPGLLSPRGQARLRGAYSTTARMNRDFTPAHITFRKTLGYGGFGVAALFGLHDSTGKEIAVVVKADLPSTTEDSTKTEKNNMILMSGAQHVVQRTLLTQFPWPKDKPERHTYIAALARAIVKLFIFLVRVSLLSLLTLIQLSFLCLVLPVDWTLRKQAARANAGREPAGQPADYPGPARPDQPPSPKFGFASWRWRELWPEWPAEQPTSVLGIDGAIRWNRKKLDKRQDIICMEFLKFGDLSKWITKLAKQQDDQRAPENGNDDAEYIAFEKVAWAIFECLWRGCIALTYPKGFYQGKDPLTTQVP